jgi:hypothetical protein
MSKEGNLLIEINMILKLKYLLILVILWIGINDVYFDGDRIK